MFKTRAETAKNRPLLHGFTNHHVAKNVTLFELNHNLITIFAQALNNSPQAVKSLPVKHALYTQSTSTTITTFLIKKLDKRNIFLIYLSMPKSVHVELNLAKQVVGRLS